MRSVTWMAICLASVVFTADVARAFQTTQPGTTKPAATTMPSVEDLSIEAIQARIKQLEENSDLEATAKNKAIDNYKLAVGFLQSVEQFASKAAQFEKARIDAPAELERIKQELKQPLPPVKPEIPSDATLPQLEAILAQVTAELQTAKDEVKTWDDEQSNRTSRRTKAPTESANAESKLDKVTKELLATPPADQPIERQQSYEVRRRAQKKAIEAQIDALKKEILSYETRGELLTARRDLAVRKVTQLETLVKAWQDIVNERRRRQAEADAMAAEQARREAGRTDPVLKEWAEKNTEIAEERKKERLVDKNEQATREFNEITKALEKLKSDSTNLDDKVKAVGLTHVMGLLLRRQRDDLPNIRFHERNVEARQSLMADTQFSLLNKQEDQKDLANVDELVNSILAKLDPSVSEDKRRDVEIAARELLQIRKDLLASFIKEYEEYSKVLLNLDIAQRNLIKEVSQFKDYIDQRILWVRSTTLPNSDDPKRVLDAFMWLFSPKSWVHAGQSVLHGLREQGEALIAAPFLLILFVSQRWLRTKLRHAGDMAMNNRVRTFMPTIGALALTILIASRWPLLVCFIAGRLEGYWGAPDVAKALAAGLWHVVGVLLMFELLHNAFRAKGLVEAHFGWSTRAVKIVRRNLVWLTAFGVPLVIIMNAIEWTTETSWHNSLGRSAFIAGQVLVSIFAFRVLRPSRGALQEIIASKRQSWLARSRYVWYPLSVGLPIVLSLLSILGYYYTAVRLSQSLWSTIWLILVLSLFNGLALRWLVISHRNIAMEQLRKRREAAQQQAAEEGKTTEGAEIPPPPEVDLSNISAQTRNLLRSAIAFALICGLWIVWSEMLPALRVFDEYKLWHTTIQVTDSIKMPGGANELRAVDRLSAVTAADLMLALVTVLVTIIAGKNVPGLIEITLLQRLPLDQAARYAITTIARYIITIIGLSIAFNMIGVGWSNVQWLAAAITVGLGFGLQEIVANFVSGLIILFERPIRIGDIVTTGGMDGKVTRIRIRATTIMDGDRREILIPNKEIITNRVINWTLTDPITRVVIPISVPHGTDTELARRLLLQVARQCDVIMSDPEPSAVFKGIGESSLNLELRAYLATRDLWPEAMNRLHTEITRAFKKAGIELAPPRDIRVQTTPEILGILKSYEVAEEPPSPPLSSDSPNKK